MQSPSSLDSRQSQFQAQASRFLKKLSNFTFRRKSGSNGQNLYQFSTQGSRSMDLNQKPFMSQPTIGLHLSDSPPNEGSSRSPSPNPPSPSRNGNPVFFPPVVEITPSNEVPISPPTLMPRTASSPSPKVCRPHSLVPARSGFDMASPPSSRSISFDIPREKPPGSLPASKSPGRKSFDARRTIFNKNAAPSPTSSTTNLSTPPNAGQGRPDLSIRTNTRGWTSSVGTTGLPKIEGLPAITPVDSSSFRWSHIPQNVAGADDSPLSAIQEHTSTPNSPDVKSHNASNNAPSSAVPPIYDQVAKWPSGQVDSATLRKDVLLRLSSLPPSSFILEGGSARLSPSVITRHPPLPLGSLPTLSFPPPATPPSTSGTTSSRLRLRHMPSLFMDGLDDEMSDHENFDDEDDDMEDEAGENATTTNPGSDDEEIALEIEVPYAVAAPNLRISQAPPSNSGQSPSMSHWSRDTPPIVRAGIDYFSSATSPLTPLGSDPEFRRRMALLASPGASGKEPIVHHHASKSMVDLFFIKKPEIADEVKGKGKAKDTGTQPVDDENTSLRSPLRRQRSLPMFQESSDPPPYPEFEKNRFTSKIEPREEEGTEKLPAYSNSIYLTAILPRKVEFTAPGVQAKDRKWRRSLCVLEGTAFKVFKPPPGATGVSAIGSWWERTVGVGDLTSTTPIPSVKRLSRPMKIDAEQEAQNNASAINIQDVFPPVQKKKRPITITSSFLSRSSNNSGNSSGRRSMDNPSEEGRNRSRRSFSIPRPLLSGNSSSSGSRSQSTSRISFDTARTFSQQRSQDSEERLLEQKELICVYSLQRAESGLASDYLKRKNVIRIRMEGQQFLLQAPSIPAVVEWIEGFQAAANVALDLEVRPMPKGPVFPRRRRRRLRPPENLGSPLIPSTSVNFI